jgi:WD40 repeat protein/serine/threonine protein kinase
MPPDPKRVQAVFLAAVEQPDPAGRAAVLDRECSDDPELRGRVEALMRAQDRPDHASDRIGVPLTGPNDGETTPVEPDGLVTVDRPSPPAITEGPGSRIGPYKLLQKIGEGGMGAVYMAEQVEPVRRKVALKIIKPGMDSDQVIARFEAERQALALMDHQNIAHVLDAGTTGTGRPYFVMELVHGVPITQYCDDAHLTLRERLELFIPVCRAIQHAHQKGIIHRDIKPSNVLVTLYDGRPVPKVIDFGVAKATDQRLTERTMFTQYGAIIGTLEYMSPEQAEMSALGVDTRSDIYSLGVLLYELLTGSTPLERDRLRESGYAEILKRIREEEPPKPSTRLSSSGDRLAALSAQRKTEPGKLRKLMRGELDWIVLKALEKDRTRRYETANGFARDLERFLAGDPVEACPPSATYRLRKLARKYRAILATAAAFAVLLVAGAAFSTWQAIAATRAEAKARAEGRRALEQTKIALEQTKIAHQRAEDLAWEDYINRVNRAYREVQDDDIALAEDLLHGCPIARRGWEWHYVNRLCHPERLSLEVPAGSVYVIAFSPDGRRIATGTGGPYSAGGGGANVALWDRATGQRRLTPRGTEHPIWSLAFSPDGTKLVVGSTNPQIEVRDVQTGEILWAKSEPRLPQAMSVAFGPDGQSLAVGFGVYAGPDAHPIKLYKAATGQETDTFPGPIGGVNDLAIHPDGRHMAVAGKKFVEVWDVGAHTKVHELRGHPGWVYGVAFSPDGKWLATGGQGGTIKLWDAVTGEERLTIFGHRAAVYRLAFSPDSRALATASGDRSVRLWEVPTGRPIGVFHGHTDFVQAVAFAPDGRELASGGLEGTTKVWDLRTSLPIAVPAGHSLRIRRDGRRILFNYDSPVRGQEITKGWDPATGEQDPTLTGIDRTTLGDEFLECPISPTPGVPPPSATSPDGRLQARLLRRGLNVYESGLRSKSYKTSAVEVRDQKTGRVLYTLIGHTADVIFIAFSPDGRRIATASHDRSIKLWDAATGREVFTLRGHAGSVVGLAFSPDGHRIVSVSHDDTARVWDASPLPVEVLGSQEARFRQKQTELQALRGRSEAEEFVNGGNDPFRTGQWEQTAADLGKTVEAYPNLLQFRYQHILALEEARDRAGVQRACKDLLEKFGNATDPAEANVVAWSCVLVPDAVADREAPIRLAENALARWSEGEKSDGLDTLGAALYRAGRFEEAIRRLNESSQTRGGERVPRGYAFLAMAHHRLGHRDESKHWLDRLRDYQTHQVYDSSWDTLEIKILRREVESLILGGRPAASPTSDPAASKNATAPAAPPARPVPE